MADRGPGPRWRKVIRDVTVNPTRTVLVVLSIAVGVFAVGTIAGSNAMLQAELQRSYAATRPSSAWFGTAPFDWSLVDAVRGLRGVEEADARLQATVRVQVGPDEWRDLDLVAVRDLTRMRLDLVAPQEGAWPPGRREILVERSGMGLLRHQIGEALVVETAGGKRHELRIAGTAHDAGAAPAFYTGQATGFVTLDTMDALGLGRAYNQLRIRTSVGGESRPAIQAFADEIRDRIERAGTAVAWSFVPSPGKHPANDILQGVFLVLGILGFLSLLVSGFLVVNTVAAILAQQVRQIGVMKAIGARTRQIAALYVVMVLVYAALSLLVALPLGALGAYGMTLFTAGLVNFDVGVVSAPPGVIALQVAVGLVVPLLAAIVPIAIGVRVTVREAISTVGRVDPFGRSWVDRVVQRVRGLPRPVLLSLRNTFRRKGRLILTLSALTLGGAVFMSVFSVRASLLRTLDDALSYFAYDVQVDLAEPTRASLVQAEALTVSGVSAAETWLVGGGQRVRPDGSDSRTLVTFGLPNPSRTVRPTVNEGRWLVPEDRAAIVITSNLLDDEPDLVVGGPFTLRVQGREERLTIVGIAQAPGVRPFLYVNQSFLERMIGSVGRSSIVAVVTDAHDAATRRQAAADVRAAFERAGIGVTGVTTADQIRETQVNLFDVLVAFLSVMAILLGAVGGLGLMGTMSINVVERAREIGILRAIGASDGAVLRIFLTEGIVIGFLAWAAGALVALPISRLMSDALGILFIRKPLSFAFSVEGTALWLGVVLALAALSSLLPSWRAARLAVRDVLAYE